MSDPYGNAAAVRAAIKDAARRRAKEMGESVSVLTKGAYFDRLLSRIFDGNGDTYVLIGGMSMLARFSGARTTTDIDLDRSQGSIEEAIADLITRAGTDLGDHFRFEHLDTAAASDSDQRQGLQAAKVRFRVYLGAILVDTVTVDLGVQKRPTNPLRPWEPDFRLHLPRLATRPYAIVALEDQIADKVAAIHARYGDDQPSSRTKDLTDLTLIARSGRPEAELLRRSLVGEFPRRSMPLPARFIIPGGWGPTYTKLARSLPRLEGFETIAAGEELVRAMIDPILGGLDGGVWDPERSSWV